MSLTTTYTGVRIVDMPDLGAITDNSSVVGEHAGSGRFAAPQLRNYVLLSVKQFGAKGDGITDDTAAIRAAVAAVPAGGGSVYFPAGTYLVSSTIYVASNTRMYGDGAASSTLKAAFNWTGVDLNGNNPCLVFFQNVNHAAPAAGAATWAYTDHDITIENLRLDYTGINMVNDSTKAVTMITARNVRVNECIFVVAGGQNATAMIACDNTVVERCGAYEARNCSYDHWWGPSRGMVTECYVSTATSGQIINWNPDATSNVTTGLSANDFTLSNSTFYATSGGAVPLLIRPLASGTTVKDVIIQGNTFLNASLSLSGATSNVIVANNLFDTLAGGGSAIVTGPLNGGTPANFAITGNVIVNPSTISLNVAVIWVVCSTAVITGNAVIGATVSCLDTGGATPVVSGNYFSNGLLNSGASTAQTGTLRLSGGVSFGSIAAASVSDLSKHIDLYAGGAGFNVTSGGLNYVVGSSGSHAQYVGGTLIAFTNSAGLNVASGGLHFGSQIAGAFNDFTKHIDLYGGTGGISVTGAGLNYVSAVAHGFYSGASLIGYFNAGGFVVNAGSLGIGGGTGPTWTTGSAAPAATAPVGSLYSRAGGAVGATLYVSRGGGTWAPVTGV